MKKDTCIEATTLLLTAVTQEKQARADQQRAILTLAQNYTARNDRCIDDETIDSLIEDISPRGRYGTLPVSEFVGMELGPLLGCSEHRANTLIFETINLYYRHRPLWDAVQSLSLDAHRASKAAGKFGNLPPDLATRAGELWSVKQHRLGWRGAIDLCDKILIQLDPAMAAEREAARLKERGVKIWDIHEGTINLTAKLDALDAHYVNATVGQIAGILRAKPEYTAVAIDVLRAKALGIMAHPAIALTLIQGSLQQPIFGTTAYTEAIGPADVDALADTGAKTDTGDGNEDTAGIPWDVIDVDSGRVTTDPHRCHGHACGFITVPLKKLQPAIQIYIHLNPADGAANIEGIGTVAVATLTELLDGKQIRITPVIDLNTFTDEHHYRPSRRLKEALHLTFPQEAFPYSNKSSRTCDLDHTRAFQSSIRDPQTRLGNLAPLSRRTHRAKTAGFWSCEQPTPGTLTWTSPLGFRYTIDHNGTHVQE
ncbi:MAG: hypothetical protein ACTHWA_07685 [Arachnia sp.]